MPTFCQLQTLEFYGYGPSQVVNLCVRQTREVKLKKTAQYS